MMVPDGTAPAECSCKQFSYLSFARTTFPAHHMLPMSSRTRLARLPTATVFCLISALATWNCGGPQNENTREPSMTECADRLKDILKNSDAAITDSARIGILERGRLEFHQQGTRACERELLLDLADLHERAGHTDRLISICDTLLDPGMRLSAERTASIKVKLATACFTIGLARSFDLAKDVFQYYQGQSAPTDRMIEATGLLVSTYELTGDNSECVALLTEALKPAEKLNDIRWTCDLLDRLGGIAASEGKGPEAIRFHERSIAELDRFFRNGAVRDTMVVRVEPTHVNDGDPPTAVDTMRELLTQKHYLTMRHRALKMLGDAQNVAGSSSAAIASYRRAIELADGSFIDELVPPYTELGNMLLAQGSTDEAVRLGEMARERAVKHGDARHLERSADLLHRAYKEEGNEGRALAMLELSSAYKDSANNINFRMGLIRKQVSYAARADSALMQLTIRERERERDDEQAKARRNRNATWAVGGAGVLLLAASGLWYRSDRRRRLERFEKDAAVLETQALRSQMNPHFIFNALNSINAFVQGNDPDMASSYLSKFARVMRLVLENSRHAEVPLESDLEALRGYLDLERKRMRDKFDYTIDIDPAIDPADVMVPPLVVQPFVENAIWHGMAGKEGQGHITLRIQQKGEQLLWIIEDDGVGRQAHQAMKDSAASSSTDAANAKKTSLGTAITRARLDLVQKQYGGRAGWSYVDTPTGTRVEVDMPMRTGS